MSYSDEPNIAKELLSLLVKELKRRLESPEEAADMKAAEFELIRKLCDADSVSLASLQRGDFGSLAQRVVEDYPFPDGPQAAH